MSAGQREQDSVHTSGVPRPQMAPDKLPYRDASALTALIKSVPIALLLTTVICLKFQLGLLVALPLYSGTGILCLALILQTRLLTGR